MSKSWFLTLQKNPLKNVHMKANEKSFISVLIDFEILQEWLTYLGDFKHVQKSQYNH